MENNTRQTQKNRTPIIDWTRFVLIGQLFQFQGICTRGIILSISEGSSRASVFIFEEERMDSDKISIL